MYTWVRYNNVNLGGIFLIPDEHSTVSMVKGKEALSYYLFFCQTPQKLISASVPIHLVLNLRDLRRALPD